MDAIDPIRLWRSCVWYGVVIGAWTDGPKQQLSPKLLYTNWVNKHPSGSPWKTNRGDSSRSRELKKKRVTPTLGKAARYR